MKSKLNIPKGTKLKLKGHIPEVVYYNGPHIGPHTHPILNKLNYHHIVEIRHTDDKDFKIVTENEIYKNLNKTQKILYGT